MATPDNPAKGPTNCIGMNWSKASSIPNITDHNMVGSSMIDTSAGVSLMNFLISLDNFLL
jgi:hypothetical protein